MERYWLDLAHYYSAPGLSSHLLLKKTGVELDLLTELDVHLFIEKGIRGEQALCESQQPASLRLRHHQAEKIHHVLGHENLYGCAMSLAVHKKGFKLKRVMPGQEQIMRFKETSRIGWILEVDLEYPGSTSCTTF